jgi:TRAP-type C4-dicarboxylate transport system substrate-binding protein
MQVPVVNNEYFQALPEGHKKVLLEAMEIFSDSVHKHAMDWEDKSYGYLVNDLKLSVVIPDEAMKAELQKRANELLAETSQVAGQKYVDWAKEILGKK